MTKKAMILIISYMIISILTVMGIAFISRSIAESTNTRNQYESTQALWLAEAAINQALYELREDATLSGTGLFSTALGAGGYSVDITTSGSDRNVTAYGRVPNTSPRVTRTINVVMEKTIPPNFYDNAIYTGGDVDLNGNSYSIVGDVRYADTIDSTSNITGTATQDSTITPLARLDFEQLYDISNGQGLVYDVDRLAADPLPTTFWHTRGDDGVDNDGDGTTDEADEWVPNVVYIDGDLQLNGNIGTIGGFFVVVGDVINTPDITQDATINGNGQIEGTIYTRGTFRVNGGGGNLNINGGVWAGDQARLNGNATITYNADYMNAIEMLNINADFQVASWRENNNPYELIP